jgi:type I restriction enzyme S subunit
VSEVDVFERDVPAVVERPPLPDGWRWGEVAEVGAKQKNAIVDGPFGSNLKLTDYVADGTVPVLTTKNLAGKYDDLRFISEQKFQELKRSAVYPNDILMAKIGSCGKTGIYPVNMPPAIIPANLLKVMLNCIQ